MGVSIYRTNKMAMERDDSRGRRRLNFSGQVHKSRDMGGDSSNSTLCVV